MLKFVKICIYFGIFIAGLIFFIISRSREKEKRLSILPLKNIELKVNCVGRFIVKFPNTVELSQWHKKYRGIKEISILKNATIDEFDNTVEKRAMSLRTTKHFRGGTLFHKTIKHSMPQNVSILYLEDEMTNGKFFEVDSFLLKQNTLFKFKCTIASDEQEVKEVTEWLDMTFKNICQRNPSEVPTMCGFCFDDYIIADSPGGQNTEIAMTMGVWSERPDVRFSFATLTNTLKPDPPLLARLARKGKTSGSKVLRSRQRDLPSGERGEEHLERVRENNGTESHLFIWEAQGLPDFNVEHPQIRLEMTTGNGKEGAVNSSLCDEDALKVWDAVVDSIRLRPYSKTLP